MQDVGNGWNTLSSPTEQAAKPLQLSPIHWDQRKHWSHGQLLSESGRINSDNVFPNPSSRAARQTEHLQEKNRKEGQSSADQQQVHHGPKH